MSYLYTDMKSQLLIYQLTGPKMFQTERETEKSGFDFLDILFSPDAAGMDIFVSTFTIKL